MTAEELFDLPGDGWRRALVEGELQRMTPAGFEHGAVVMNVAVPLGQHVRSHRLGVWGVDPGRRSVAVHEPGAAPRRLAGADVVDGEPLFPGFRLPAADVFAAGAGAAGLPSP